MMPMAQTQTLDLTVPQVAERLGMTPDGVYKLIQRGKLDAVRRSARKTRVRQEALDAYIEQHQATVQRFRDRTPTGDLGVLRERFLEQTGHTPEQWLVAWKRDDIPDTAENGQLLARAVALREDAGAAAPAMP
jgi:excisionase family DNA binding protein